MGRVTKEELKEKIEKIREYAQQGYDAFMKRSPYVDYERLAELMKNDFSFILSEIEEE